MDYQAGIVDRLPGGAAYRHDAPSTQIVPEPAPAEGEIDYPRNSRRAP